MNLQRDIRDLREQGNRIERNQRKAQDYRNEQQRAARAAREQERADQRSAVAGGVAFAGVFLIATWWLNRKERKAQEAELHRQEQDRQYRHWLASTQEGQTYWQWRQQALALEASFEDRDLRWQETWSEEIPAAASQVPAVERRRFERNRRRIEGHGLRLLATIAFLLACVATIALLFNLNFSAFSPHFYSVWSASMDECAAMLADPATNYPADLCTNTDAEFRSVVAPTLTVLSLMAGFLLAWFVLDAARRLRRRAALKNHRVLGEVQARTDHFGYDPLALPAGWVPFRWWSDPAFSEHRHDVQHLVWNGSTLRPQPDQLIQLVMPAVRSTDQRLPQTINALLTEYSQ